ncbi:tetratricopeptide repeat protein [Paraburkholderia rhizosphaerae]|uniref:Tetratricopeptide (TPR) repeat protein n=1 Tax=Paraburkholderia rhizosphaerae TaxID=480658 RepID=A0A4R8LVS5_9BURK|nr:tetratricopeptide repeat protein [Paraburkholderia rhizosphaerae]TDY51933.1 tetratricopeptide (TPR) repeat protein [Paraburkholderia rhizosphaerae]
MPPSDATPRADSTHPTTQTHPTALALALEAHRANRLDEAGTLYRAALASVPDHPDALHYYGVLLYQRGDHCAAATLLDRSLTLDPSNAECWSNRGLVAAASDQHELSLHCYRNALRLKPAFADAHNNLAVALQSQGALDEAVDHYRRALAIDPSLVDAHVNLGSALGKLGRHDDAYAHYEIALSLDPRSAQAHFNAGNARQARGDFAAAADHFRQAVAAAPTFADAYVNLGTALGKLGEYPEAERHYRQAVALNGNATNLVCLGASLGAQGRHDEEEPFYRAALALEPDQPDAHQNLAWLYLKRGDYLRGWAEYAKRWRASDYEAIAVEGIAEWRGEPIDGKRILLVREQGFGDQFQFLRYAQVLAGRGATVDVCTRAPLLELAQRVPGVRRAWTGTPGGDYDFWVSLMSVPACIGTDLHTIPATVPYLFADPLKAAHWRTRLRDTVGAQPKVGLVWAGSPTFGNDRYRSMPLAALAPLCELTGVAWLNLQKGVAREQLAVLPDAIRPIDFTAELNDFADTAALIDNLDLVITVDTAVAHLTGAMGKPVWVMLPANSDWRWLEHRSDSPWYPTARLFRQTMLGDWAPVVERMRDALVSGE